MQNYGALETFFFGLELFAVWMTVGCWIFSDILFGFKESNTVHLSVVEAPQLSTPSPEITVERQAIKEGIKPYLTLVETNTDKPSVKTINDSNRNELRSLCKQNAIQYSRVNPGSTPHARKKDLTVKQMKQTLISKLYPTEQASNASRKRRQIKTA